MSIGKVFKKIAKALNPVEWVKKAIEKKLEKEMGGNQNQFSALTGNLASLRGTSFKTG